jgi:hypothetical protein
MFKKLLMTSNYYNEERHHTDPAHTVYLTTIQEQIRLMRFYQLKATSYPADNGSDQNYWEYLNAQHVVVLHSKSSAEYAANVANQVQTTAQPASVMTMYWTLPLLGGAIEGTTEVNFDCSRPDALLRETMEARFKQAGLERAPTMRQKPMLILSTTLDTTSKALLLALLHKMQYDRTRFETDASASTLGRLTGLHRVTAQNTLAELRRIGVLRREDAGHAIAWDIVAAMIDPDMKLSETHD